MSATFLSTKYLIFNILLILGGLGLQFMVWFGKYIGFRVSSRSELKLHYFSLGTIILLFGVQTYLPKAQIFTPPVKVWSSDSRGHFDSLSSGTKTSEVLQVGSMTLSESTYSHTFILVSFLISFFVLYTLSRDILALRRIRKNGFKFRKIGKICIYIHEGMNCPLSFWLPGSANIVIPYYLLQNPIQFKMVVFHELQHHRQKDSIWIYILNIIKLFCYFNPFVHLWFRRVSELQELSCDEAMTGIKKFNVTDYVRCILDVAQLNSDFEKRASCAAGLVFSGLGKPFNRRIRKMILSAQNQNLHKLGSNRLFMRVTGSLFIILMGFTAFAARGLIQDRRITLEKALEMAGRSSSEKRFPIVVNELVVKELNRYVGTPDGREFIKESLNRMTEFKSTILQLIVSYNLPEELLAIPIVESGYQNLSEKQSHTKLLTAGLWQFTRTTAKNYGLNIEPEQDERLNPQLSSDAALRLLLSDNLRFKDWQLAILAFNMGEQRVQQSIIATRSRDPWTLIRNGNEGDKGYLAKVMATILIMNNPEILK